MRREGWTYELPPAGAPDVGIEQYQVAVPDGGVWKAAVLLAHEDDLYVAAAPSGVALARHLVAIPWEAVARVDHDELMIHVRSLDNAVELDPGRAVENERAEARRVPGLPPGVASSQATGDVAGPRDRLPLFLGLGAAAAGFVALLGVIALVTAADDARLLLLLVLPGALLLAGVWLSIAAWRRPYAPATRDPDGS
ncbi:MAG TPA: hypothetical protein VFN93_01510 [Gaiellaceae bacterium]|nr:hypothetical protein [Gaiellaceae bacterium]